MNPLSEAIVSNIVKHDEHTVEFGINLAEYPYLADPNLLTACMNQYQFMYQNTVSGWQAFVEQDIIRIVVTGRVRWENFRESNV